MSDAMVRSRCGAWSMLLLVAGCEAEPGPDWWEGEHLRYTASSGNQACAGTPIVADDFVAFVAGELGLGLPDRIEYHWLDGRDYADSNCSDNTSGCAIGRRAYAMEALLLHELVHTVAAGSKMNGLSFFAEGLAVTYDPLTRFMDSRYVIGFPSKLADPRPQMPLASGEVSYQTAGGFVNFLLTRHGPAKLVAISQRSHKGDDLTKIGATFRDVYDLELDDEAELYMKSAELGCDDDHFDVRPHDCTMPEVAWSGENWVYARILDCEDEDVVGGYNEHSSRSVTLEVPTGGQYRVRTFGDGHGIRLGRCFGCPWQHNDVLLWPQNEALVTLEAGRYFVRTEGSTTEPPLVGVALTPVE